MASLNELLMHAIFNHDLKSVKMYLKRDESGSEVKINKICSNGMTLIGAAAQAGNINIVKCLLDFSNKSDQLPLDIRNDNHQQVLRLDLSNAGNSHVTKKKNNIGYFFVCRETEELGEGPTPDGMEGLEWDMEVDEGSQQQESTPSKSPEVNLYQWYADILSRTAVILKSPEHDLGRLDGLGFGILHYATRADNPLLLDYLLSNCPVLCIDQPDQTGLTPLHIAASFASSETVSFLLSKGANLHAVTQERQTALHLAADYKQHDIVKLLLEKGANVNASDLRDRTPLSLAVESGDIETVRTLIAAGARLNLEEADGVTPLYRAVSNDDVEIACLLLENGARIVHSHFLLHTAAQNGNVDMIRAIIRAAPVLVNTRDLQGNTPLMLACSYGHVQAAACLLNSEANPNTRNNISGLTALHICIRSVENITVLKQLVELLIDHGADLNVTSYQGTALWYAVALEKFDAATLLIQNGANVDIWDEKMAYDILSLARRHKADNLVQLLIYAGHTVKNMVLPLQSCEQHFTFLKNIQRSPLPLRDLCRITIRKSIGSQRFVSKVHQLPLPKLLKDYLTFQVL